MKFATWNINECVGITCYLNNQQTTDTINLSNIEEIIRKINEYDFDVICFQEYPVYIDDKISLTNQIINNTSLKYYAEKDTYNSYLFKGGRVGIAIFSKYKIIDKYYAFFCNPHMMKISSKGIKYESFDKGIIKITIIKDNDYFTIITGHAMAFAPFDKTEFDYPESYRPLEDIIRDCKNDNLIVMGDFNTEKLYEIMPSINNIIKDTIIGPTTKDYYEKRGEVHMDYIMINQKINCMSTYKIDNFSDHYIIYSELLLNKENSIKN